MIKKILWKVRSIGRAILRISFYSTVKNIQHYAQRLLLGYSYRDGWDISPSVHRTMVPVFREYLKSYRKIGSIPGNLHLDFKAELEERFEDENSKEAFEYLAAKWTEIVETVYWALERVHVDLMEECLIPNPDYVPGSDISFEYVSANVYTMNPRCSEFILDKAKYQKLADKRQLGLEYFGKYMLQFWT